MTHNKVFPSPRLKIGSVFRHGKCALSRTQRRIQKYGDEESRHWDVATPEDFLSPLK